MHAVISTITQAWQRISGRAAAQPSERLELTEQGVARRFGEGIEQVAWDDIERILVYTNDLGPFQEDFFYLLVGPDNSGVLVGQDLAVRANLLPVLQARFAGFDNEALIRACGSTSDAMFLLWMKDNAALATAESIP